MKKSLIVLLIITIGTILFMNGCSSENKSEGGSSNKSEDYENGSDFDSAIDPQNLHESSSQDNAGTNESGLTNDATKDLKIIKISNVNLETSDVTGVINSIKNYAKVSGGYVEASGIDSFRDNNKELKSGNITIRVPTEMYEKTLEDVLNAGKVISQKDTTENVTMQYIDYEGKLKVKRIEESRLLELVSQAASIEAIISLETRLSEVRNDIEYMTSTLRNWDNLVKMSTIIVSITEKLPETVAPQADRDILGEFKDAFIGSINGAIYFFVNLSIFIAGNWIGIIIAVIILALLIKKFKLIKRVKESFKQSESGQDDV